MHVFAAVRFSFRWQKKFLCISLFMRFFFRKNGGGRSCAKKTTFFRLFPTSVPQFLIHSNYGQVFFLGKTLTCRSNFALYVFLWFLLWTLFNVPGRRCFQPDFFFRRFSQFFRSVNRSRIYFPFVSLSFHLVTIHSEYEMCFRIWRGFAYEFMKNDFLTQTFVSK